MASLVTTAKRSPAIGVPLEAKHFDGHRRPSFGLIGIRSSTSARTRPHSLPAMTMSPGRSVPRLTSTVATGPRPLSSPASITTPSAGLIRIGLQFEHFGLQDDGFEQLVDALAGLGRTSTSMVSPPIAFDDTSCWSKLGADLGRIGGRHVDLVDGDNHRHLGGADVVDRLDRLRHHAVIGGNDEDDDIRRLCTACPHGGERLVAGGVDEGYLGAVLFYLVGADMLGDAARFAGDDIGVADGVEQRRLAVVDVTHDRHHRRPWLQRFRRVVAAEDAFLNIAVGNALDGVAEIGGDQFGSIGVDDVAGRQDLALLHQVFDNVDRTLRHAHGEFLNGNGFGQDNLAGNLLARTALLRGTARLFLAPAHRRHRHAAQFALFVERVGERQLGAPPLVAGLSAGDAFVFLALLSFEGLERLVLAIVARWLRLGGAFVGERRALGLFRTGGRLEAGTFLGVALRQTPGGFLGAF